MKITLLTVGKIKEKYWTMALMSTKSGLDATVHWNHRNCRRENSG